MSFGTPVVADDGISAIMESLSIFSELKDFVNFHELIVTTLNIIWDRMLQLKLHFDE